MVHVLHAVILIQQLLAMGLCSRSTVTCRRFTCLKIFPGQFQLIIDFMTISLATLRSQQIGFTYQSTVMSCKTEALPYAGASALKPSQIFL